MKSSKYPKCGPPNIYFKEYALNKVNLDGKQVECVSVEKLGDWKKARY